MLLGVVVGLKELDRDFQKGNVVDVAVKTLSGSGKKI